MDRYKYLEMQLDKEDLTDEEFNLYNKELNQLEIEKQTRKASQQAIRAQQLKEEQEEKELEKILSLTEDEVDKMYEDSCIKHDGVNGMSFKDWYAQSLKYYDIDSGFNVNARARSFNTVEIIPHLTYAQAKLTILKRIKYKFYDHAIRGRDFAYEL
jgi:Tfp pilus assembly protein PilN